MTDEEDREQLLRELREADDYMYRKGRIKPVKNIYLPGDKKTAGRFYDEERTENMAKVLKKNGPALPL